MEFLTNDKLVIVGAGGAIGSNMAQTALMLGLTPNICLYDIYGPGVNGVAEELYHCAFEGANITWTTDPEVAFTGAKYIISSGGAPRKEGMTREDLLKGNCQIAAEFGDNIKLLQRLSVQVLSQANLLHLLLSTLLVFSQQSQRSLEFLSTRWRMLVLMVVMVRQWQCSLLRSQLMESLLQSTTFLRRSGQRSSTLPFRVVQTSSSFVDVLHSRAHHISQFS